MALLKPYLTLCRLWISFFAACSAATGFFLAPEHHAARVVIPATAVFFLACGASALNQFQERDIDAKMERTRTRPLPSGAMAPARVVVISALLMLAGLSLVSLAGPAATMLGVSALIWYNGVYTYLKRITAFAAVPGAAVGMIPPLIGWVSTGGALLDARIAALCLLFFLWQVPHFWLLLLDRGEDYERAGLPSLTKVMSNIQIARITYVWITAAAVASLALPLYGLARKPSGYFPLLSLSLWLIWSGKSLAEKSSFPSRSFLLFRKINIYLFLMMTLLTMEGIFF